MPSILFVCLGNICRSPTAHSVFEHLIEQEGLAGRVRIDSAGMGGWHVGNPPDERAQDYAARRGYCMSHLRARQVCVEDFDTYDLILAMDRDNLNSLLRLSPSHHHHKIRLFMEFAEGVPEQEVPDPYYGGGEGFELVLDLVEQASEGLLAHLREQYSL